jgi:uncharacterized protein
MKPVIIVYAKAPVPGQVKTRLIPRLGAAGAARLHEALVEDTLAMAETLGDTFDVELHTDISTGAWSWVGVRRLQSAGDLGARMYATLRASLDGGRPFVIILGSDSPGLPRHFLAQLADLQADVVLGPTRDGGYYAIGCRRIDPAMFAEVVWSSPAARAQTEEAARRCGLTVAHGPEWFDVDEPGDLDALMEAGATGRTAQVLRECLCSPS